MSNDSISRVYQFLAKQGNWDNKADANGDGAVTKTEFRNYMEDNFEWDGTPTDSEKNDLINSFWNTIDTNQSGKISGTNLKNKNALDSKEIANMENKIEMYEILNDFTSKLSAPNGISDSLGWKKSVSESLGSLVEEFIKEGGKAEDLEAYLEENSQSIERKATADFFASEYLSQVAGDMLKDLDYYYNDDATLNEIINNYINNSIPEDASFEDIQNEIKEIINAYLATAGLGEGSDSAFDLSQYGYSQQNGSKLNDLQKAVVKSKLDTHIDQSIETVFESIFKDISFGSEEAKENFNTALKTVIEEAKTSFIDSLTYKDFLDIDTKIAEFDLSSFVTDDMKNPVLEEFYTEEAEELLDSLADELANGITQTRASEVKTRLGLDLYNSEYGDYKLDKETIRTLLKDLNSSLESFIASFIASGADTDEFEAQLQDYIESYLMGGNSEAVDNAIEIVTEDPFISDRELAEYKETCIAAIESVLGSANGLKLGSKTLTSSNYKDLINAYTDGNDLMDDLVTLLRNIDTDGKLADYIDATEEAIADEQSENTKDAASTLADTFENIRTNGLASIIGNSSKMHTEFGMDTNGNIVFQEEETTAVYNNLVNKVLEEFNKTSEGKAALEQMGGESVVKKLIQAAWITTYNTYNSSTKNSRASFITTVLDNLEAIFNKLETNPEYLEIFTEHTAYADSSLTTGLTHYGTKTTRGNDEDLRLIGGYEISSDGTVHLANEKDDPDYQVTMSELLSRVIKKYSSIDSTLVTSVFREAQQKAIDVCENYNTPDCPYGTGYNDSSVEDGNNKDWGGSDTRNGGIKSIKYREVHVDELVQLTLYFFDKLLYKNLIS